MTELHMESLDQHLNVAGQAGWELVDVTHFTERIRWGVHVRRRTQYIFKRPVAPGKVEP